MIHKTTIRCMGLALALMAYPASGQETIPTKPSDLEIRNALEVEYVLDAAVDLNTVYVAVNDGIAELTGRVDNLLARRRATHIAEAVRGIRSVSNRIKVTPSPVRWDADIRRDAHYALLADPATDSYEIDLTVKNGVVTMDGQVDSMAERRLCNKVVAGVRGVTDVIDRLEIRVAAVRPDHEIQPEIAKSLHWDVLVDADLIDVTVQDGVATLKGVVGSAAERRKAIADAWVAGVKKVNADALTVQAWSEDGHLRKKKHPARTDAQIEDAIKWAALHDPRVKSFRVEPHVNDGWVTLRGTVSNLQAKRAAEYLARHTTGVFFVDNRIKVRHPAARDKVDIASDVRRALQVDPYTEAYDISVVVKDSKVTLTGTVDDFFERARAEALATRVRGVEEVKNRLMVEDEELYIVPALRFAWMPALTPLPLEPRSDEAIRRHVREQLFWSPFVDSTAVKVKAEDGVVTLTGTVDSYRARMMAADRAYSGGAKIVANLLKVE